MLRHSHTARRASHRRHVDRHGLTLIEIMVSLSLVLVIMVTTLTIFAMISEGVSDSRALMELVDRQKAAVIRLQADLAGVTALTLPPIRPESASGYLEVIEGKMFDGVGNSRVGRLSNDMSERDKQLGEPPYLILGDCDDVLMMTVHSRGRPFVGRGPEGKVIESNLAEVVWFVAPAQTGTQQRPLTLYRRVLLIRPDLQLTGGSAQQFFQQYDISARQDTSGTSGGGGMVPNTLADLTHPENRFSHTKGNGTVGRVNLQSGGAGQQTQIRPLDQQSGRLGEDVVLTNCVGFDLKVYDARASVGENTSQDNPKQALLPGDFGYSGGASSGRGAYVDVGFEGRGGGGPFSKQPSQLSKIRGSLGSDIAGIYDTWSYHYEYDGVAQAGGDPDKGTDGKDNDGKGGADDGAERETLAPIPWPLRGIQVKVRVYEPVSRQVREVTVTQDYTPR